MAERVGSIIPGVTMAVKPEQMRLAATALTEGANHRGA